jgi:hypothetical protein
MFEAQVAFYLNKYLGSWLEGIDAQSLRHAAPAPPLPARAQRTCRSAVACHCRLRTRPTTFTPLPTHCTQDLHLPG